MGSLKIWKKILLAALVVFFYISLKTLNAPDPTGHPQPFEVKPSTVFTVLSQPKKNVESKENASAGSNQSVELKKFPDFVKVAAPTIKSSSEKQCMSKWLGTPPSILKNPKHVLEDEKITCSALLFGNITRDAAIYDQAKAYMEKHKRKKPVSDSYFQENIEDIGCMKFKLSRGYQLNALSQEEEEFPIAYNLIIHKDIEQVETLLHSIYRPQNSYCIHVDAKVKPDVIESVRAIASCFDNVFLASRLERIVYAGYTRLQADINCMKDQLNSPIKWKYLINTAGQAMPAKSNLEMVKILKIYNGANDIEGIYGPRVHRSRFENEWVETGVDTNHPDLKKTGQKNPKPPYDIDIVRGSAYGVFSRNFTEWMINDKMPVALLEWSKKTWSPDEHYWATLHHRYSNPHLKSPGGFSGEPNSKPWLAVWVAWGGVDKCYGRWSRGTCVFGVRDLPALTKLKHFMINKFAVDVEPLAQECLARYIDYKSDCVPPMDEEYYRKLPFILKPKA